MQIWFVIAMALLVTACGADGTSAPETRAGDRHDGAGSASTPTDDCPTGTRVVKARDVIGDTPDGFQVAAGDRRVLDALVAPLRSALGDRWRGYDARVLVRSGAENGAVVIVINSTERTGGLDEIVGGAEEAARERGTEVQRVDIGGHRAPLIRAADGGYLASAPAGPCAVTMLVADTEALLRDAAAALSRR